MMILVQINSTNSSDNYKKNRRKFNDIEKFIKEQDIIDQIMRMNFFLNKNHLKNFKINQNS